MTELVQEKLKTLPDSPGVYIMKNAQGKIIYVGKAVVLKNRVRQYFQSNKNHGAKVKAMVAKIVDFETIVTASEVEALILECNLIKKHRPRYNICLKDDKSYPYLKLTLNEDFPRVFVTRRIVDDGSKYFGPYTNSQAVKDSLELLRKLFPLRTCKTLGKRPCLEYHINRCLAPCVNKISRADYADLVKATEKFLEGKTADVERDLTAKISQAAESLNFELAAKLRDILFAVKKISEKQKIVTDTGDLDVIGISRLNDEVCAQIFFVREGKVSGRESFLLNGAADEVDAKVTAEFIKQYYSRSKISSTEIILPVTLLDEDITILTEWLGVKISEPKRGVKRSLVEMAVKNAEKYLAELSARRELKVQTSRAVEDLQKFLHLPKLPRKMECFDISHFQGAETVASMVVFVNGEPSKKDYRRFKIRSTEGKPDDFLSMREVTGRRYGKLTAEELPDLIVIDGGIGQLNSALEIIRGFGHEVPVVGLAKEFELIFVEGESVPIELPRESQALYLMQRIRDEAHRFAITYHRKLRRARNLKSELDNVAGIGAKRRAELFKKFGTLDKIKSATLDELLNVPTMNKTAAESLINFFNVERKII